MFEELYEDYLSHLKIRRLVKAFSIKSDCSVKKYKLLPYIYLGQTPRDGEDREARHAAVHGVAESEMTG